MIRILNFILRPFRAYNRAMNRMTCIMVGYHRNPFYIPMLHNFKAVICDKCGEHRLILENKTQQERTNYLIAHGMWPQEWKDWN